MKFNTINIDLGLCLIQELYFSYPLKILQFLIKNDIFCILMNHIKNDKISNFIIEILNPTSLVFSFSRTL